MNGGFRIVSDIHLFYIMCQQNSTQYVIDKSSYVGGLPNTDLIKLVTHSINPNVG